VETDACNFQHPPEAEARFFMASGRTPHWYRAGHPPPAGQVHEAEHRARDADDAAPKLRQPWEIAHKEAARAAFAQLAETWGSRISARYWQHGSTRWTRGTGGRSRHAATSYQAALKHLYLVTRSLDPTGTGRTRWAMRW